MQYYTCLLAIDSAYFNAVIDILTAVPCEHRDEKKTEFVANGGESHRQKHSTGSNYSGHG